MNCREENPVSHIYLEKIMNSRWLIWMWAHIQAQEPYLIVWTTLAISGQSTSDVEIC